MSGWLPELLKTMESKMLADGYQHPDVQEALNSIKKEAYWSALLREVLACKRCPFGQDAQASTQRVPGTGNRSSPLMLVGEGPGFDEDRIGVPFTGISGALLTLALHKLNLQRQEIYITNVIKCRPANNRTPRLDEIQPCSRYLRAELKLIKPKTILCLGRVALQFFFPEITSIKEVRGKWLEYQGIPVMPTYHPAFILRQTGSDLALAKRQWWLDLCQAYRMAYSSKENRLPGETNGNNSQEKQRGREIDHGNNN